VLPGPFDPVTPARFGFSTPKPFGRNLARLSAIAETGPRSPAQAWIPCSGRKPPKAFPDKIRVVQATTRFRNAAAQGDVRNHSHFTAFTPAFPKGTDAFFSKQPSAMKPDDGKFSVLFSRLIKLFWHVTNID
jgi:hypothetical protein